MTGYIKNGQRTDGKLNNSEIKVKFHSTPSGMKIVGGT